MNSEELKPCRFCQSSNVRRPMQDLWSKWIIGCADCGAEGSQAETPEQAVGFWNAPDPRITELETEVAKLEKELAWERSPQRLASRMGAVFVPRAALKDPQSDGWTERGRDWLAAGCPPIGKDEQP